MTSRFQVWKPFIHTTVKIFLTRGVRNCTTVWYAKALEISTKDL